MKLIIISNRLPISVTRNTKTDDKENFIYKRNSGGLVTGLLCVHQHFPFLWIGNIPGEFNDIEKNEIISTCKSKYGSIPLFIPSDLNHAVYDKYCNQVLWPLFHFFSDNIIQSDALFLEYEKFNKMFADVIYEELKACSDAKKIVWVHDYHLMLLPQLLKKLKQDNVNTISDQKQDFNIAFFLHIPFPTPDVFSKLPESRKILESLLCADLIAFHTREYSLNFKACVRELLKEAQENNFNDNDENILICLFCKNIFKSDFFFYENSICKSCMSKNDVEKNQEQNSISQVSLNNLTYSNFNQKLDNLKHSKRYNTYLNNHSIKNEEKDLNLSQELSNEENIDKKTPIEKDNLKCASKRITDSEVDLKNTLIRNRDEYLTECLVQKKKEHRPKLRCYICKLEEGCTQVSSSEDNFHMDENPNKSSTKNHHNDCKKHHENISGGNETKSTINLSSKNSIKDSGENFETKSFHSISDILTVKSSDSQQEEFESDSRIQTSNKPSISGDSILFDSHKTSIKAIPIGIDPLHFSSKLKAKETLDFIKFYKNKFKNCFIILGVDRVDYIKGIPERIRSYGDFLKLQKEVSRIVNDKKMKRDSKIQNNKIRSETISTDNFNFDNLTDQQLKSLAKIETVFIQIGVPSRNNVKGYQHLNNLIRDEVDLVNAKKQTSDLLNHTSKVYYLNSSISVNELIALYHVADMCIISSVRDGMNLVAMEYIACSGKGIEEIDVEMNEIERIYKLRQKRAKQEFEKSEKNRSNCRDSLSKSDINSNVEKESFISQKLTGWFSSKDNSKEKGGNNSISTTKSNNESDNNDFIDPILDQQLESSIKASNDQSKYEKHFIDSILDCNSKANPGILTLSIFAGTANSLPGSIFINPWEGETISNAIIKGIFMEKNERIYRFLINRRVIQRISAKEWAMKNIDCLGLNQE